MGARAETASIGDAAGDGEKGFVAPPDFDAAQIAGMIRAEIRTAEHAAKPRGQSAVIGGDRHRRRQTARNVFGETGARKRRARRPGSASCRTSLIYSAVPRSMPLAQFTPNRFCSYKSLDG